MRFHDHLAYLIASVNKRLEDDLQDRLRAVGMPVEQLRVLAVLVGSDGLSMSELARSALVEPTTLTKIIDRMVTDHLVSRLLDSLDRRRVLITLAPAGKVAFQRLSRFTTSQEARIRKLVPKSKLEELRMVLRALAQG